MLIDSDVPFAAEPFLEMLRARWRESVKPVVPPTMFMPIDRLTPEEARALPGVVRAYRSAVAECERRPDLEVACWLVEVEMFAAVELYMVGNAGQCTAGRVVVTAAGWMSVREVGCLTRFEECEFLFKEIVVWVEWRGGKYELHEPAGAGAGRRPKCAGGWQRA